MGNSLASRKNGRSSRTDEESGAPGGADGGRSSSSDEEETRPLWMRVLHRVPPRLREKNKPVYDPSVVSLGPYHHGQPQLRQLEEFKDELVSIMLKADDRRHLFRAKILERIEDIRHFYGGLSSDEYDDEALAEMMLRDACVVLYCVELNAAKEDDDGEKVMFLFRRLGMFQVSLMAADVYKLENQIPWWLMNSLISLAYDDKKEEGEALMRRFLSFQTFGNFTKLKQLPWYRVRDEYHPLHLLEALRNTSLINLEEPESNALDFDRYEEEIAIIANEAETSTNTDLVPSPCPAFKCKWWRRKSSAGGFLQPGKRPFRSVTELKAKGIYFKPSSNFLLDIRFASYYFFGVLHLPVVAVSKDAGVAFSNIVALEMSPGTACVDSVVTSYISFMKSMVDNSKDVKALQEKGIVVSFMEDNQEIVRMFKDVDSYGGDVLPIFDDIKIRINDHCNSKAKTWIAELINTNFRSPWTTIALVAAIFLLCLTFLQTYYTINPRNT